MSEQMIAEISEYIQRRAAAFMEQQRQDEKIKRKYIAGHGELVGLILYREYLNRKA